MRQAQGLQQQCFARLGIGHVFGVYPQYFRRAPACAARASAFQALVIDRVHTQRDQDVLDQP